MTVHGKEAMKRMSNLISFLPVVFVVIVIVYEKYRQKNIRSEKEYDEMQLEIRGKGAWYGFYTLILYWAVCFLLEQALNVHFLSASNAVFFGIMISGSVIAGYSILHDSYYGMNRTGSKNGFFLVMIALIEAAAVVILVKMAGEGVFQDFSKTCTDERLLILLCLPMFTTILTATLIRRLKPEEKGEE